MALEKQITFDNGITANYHIIGSLIREQGLLKMSVLSYVSEEYREDEKSIFATYQRLRTLQEDGSEEALIEANQILVDNPFLLNNADKWIRSTMHELIEPQDFSYAEAYNYLKTLPEFEDSKDV